MREETYTDVSQAWDGTDVGRFLTLYISGCPSGSEAGRADYWSLSLDQATALGERLIREAGRAAGLANARGATGPPA